MTRLRLPIEWMGRLVRRAAARFTYPDAGRGAQPEVIAAVDRFRALPDAERADVHLWGWLLGPDGTPPYKIDRADIRWNSESSGDERCGNCGHYYVHVTTDTGLCDAVAGVWGADWWCDRWHPGRPAKDYRRYQR